MTKLTKVSIISELGWVPITAEEATKIHPGGTVSAHDGIFKCDLCNQYVTFTYGQQRTRHFRHASGEADKNCPQRTFGPAYVPTFNAEERELPIKLIADRDGFRFELGLLYVPENILRDQPTQSVTIRAFEGEHFVYSFERLNADMITYLPIGSEPSTKYEVIAPKGLSGYWPQKVKGIDCRGNVFDGRTGKMLPAGADVQVNKKYFLLTTTSFTRYLVGSNIKLNTVCENRIGGSMWRVYEVEAETINAKSAEFFLKLPPHYRLTDSPMRMRPIWPVHIETPYVVKHNGDCVTIHITGAGRRDFSPKAFPKASILKEQCSRDNLDSLVVKIHSDIRQQVLATGVANVLQYTCLWKEELNNTVQPVPIEVLDGVGAPVNGGEQYRLPVSGVLKVTAPYNGTVVIKKRGNIVEKYGIASGKRITLNEVRYGTEIHVLQGLDIVWHVQYIKNKTTNASADEVLFDKLNSFQGQTVRVGHSIGAMAKALDDYPKAKGWIYSVIKNGFASEGALKYLRNYYIEIANRQRGDF